MQFATNSRINSRNSLKCMKIQKHNYNWVCNNLCKFQWRECVLRTMHWEYVLSTDLPQYSGCCLWSTAQPICAHAHNRRDSFSVLGQWTLYSHKKKKKMDKRKLNRRNSRPHQVSLTVKRDANIKSQLNMQVHFTNSNRNRRNDQTWPTSVQRKMGVMSPNRLIIVMTECFPLRHWVL